MGVHKQLAYIGNPWRLTVREFSVLVRLAEHTRREIGRQISLAEPTVADHIKAIFIKMEVRRTPLACVLFDRWWQAWQRANAEQLPQVWEDLNL